MDLRQYSEEVDKTAIHPNELPEGHHPNLVGLLYCAAKLCGEAGEVSEVIGKSLRDDNGCFPPDRLEQIVKEMGDVDWYLSRICNLLGLSRENILARNVDKLKSRQQRGTLHGDGDNR